MSQSQQPGQSLGKSEPEDAREAREQELENAKAIYIALVCTTPRAPTRSAQLQGPLTLIDRSKPSLSSARPKTSITRTKKGSIRRVS